jgi:hypothetical protein
MKGFRVVNLHCPIHKVKVKKTHYRLVLFSFATVAIYAHYNIPEHESLIAYLVNVLFVIDPTA